MEYFYGAKRCMIYIKIVQGQRKCRRKESEMKKGSTKRIVSAIATAIMTVSLFSGCAADEAVQEEKDTTSVYL